MKSCPHCKKQCIGIYQCMLLNNWRPSYCSSCGGAFINSEKSVYLSLALFVFLFIINLVVGFNFKSIYFSGFLMPMFIGLGLLAYAQFSTPTKYKNLVMYTKRPWYAHFLFYVLLPVVIVCAVFFTIIVLPK